MRFYHLLIVLEGLKAGQLRYDVKDFSVLYAGTCGVFPVRFSAAFDIPVVEWDQKPQLEIPRIPDLFTLFELPVGPYASKRLK